MPAAFPTYPLHAREPHRRCLADHGEAQAVVQNERGVVPVVDEATDTAAAVELENFAQCHLEQLGHHPRRTRLGEGRGVVGPKRGCILQRPGRERGALLLERRGPPVETSMADNATVELPEVDHVTAPE